MGVHKVIEVLSQSPRSWEDATQKAVAEAAETVDDIKSAYVKEMMAIVDNNKVTQYRVNLKVTFEVATNRPKGGKKAR
ncbi:MAG TPA: dodecin family protein [Gemmatimonadota bacterium]|jgi:flavin-binding protein dodecin|nr:dodecin family protein [Gemmatimonadota bacterium]